MGQPRYRGARNETVEYIQAMLEQLRGLAKAQDCDMLAYLIEIACIEASDAAREARHGDDDDGASHVSHDKGDGAT